MPRVGLLQNRIFWYNVPITKRGWHMVFRNLAVLACMFTCAASAFARAEFASLAQAQAAFATDEPTVRERAYRYVLESVGAADGRDAFARLQVLRPMAGALAGQDAARVLLLRQRKVEAFRAVRMDAETEREAAAWFPRALRRA